MDILEKYPIIARVMYSDKEENPTSTSPHDYLSYKKAEEMRAQLNSELERLLLNRSTADCREDLKHILYSLESATDDMENIAADYSFIKGFKLCAKLIFEMIG